MDYKDYYQILGLERDASQDDIKRVYRKLARKYHPDVSKQTDAEDRFKEVGEAYEVLKDPEKRAAYDQLGSNWQAGQDFNVPPGWAAGFEFGGGSFAGGDSDYSDFFESLFGHGFGPRERTAHGRFHARGEDHHAKILVDLEDAWQGGTRTITLRIPGVNAQGHLQLAERHLKVRIPKGVTEGQHIRLAGQGAAGSTPGAAGDLYLEIAFRPHPLYRVDGRDLYLEVPIAPWEAALGATVKTPTPGGPVELKIPPGSAAGGKLRLKGKGIPGKPHGDLYAVLQIALPTAQSAEAKALYEQMRRDLTFNPRAHFGL
ncbi:MAG: DnaJ domain-containing protein [Gammaproteobacteria bacterium]|nr:DnaJ domain-containing protein [Gammaproteobacteria bacterium]